MALGVLLYLERFWVSQAEGVIGMLRYPLLGLGLILAVLVCYLFPTMATFRATLPQLLKNCVYFAVKRPVTLVLVLLAHMVPLGLTWLEVTGHGLLATWQLGWASGPAHCQHWEVPACSPTMMVLLVPSVTSITLILAFEVMMPRRPVFDNATEGVAVLRMPVFWPFPSPARRSLIRVTGT